jgi:transcription-repair coupling factor (superfamily II helicase)
VPEPAEALLDVARLRAECARIGLREVNVVRTTGFGAPTWTARIGPVQLKVSQEVRLKRLAPKAIHKPDLRQLVLPVKGGRNVPNELVELLATLFPADVAA